MRASSILRAALLACAGAALAAASAVSVPRAARAEPRAFVAIEPGGTLIGSSTFNAGSFRIRNDSTAGERIDRVSFDLGGAALPDLVFDPNGTAGDTVAKDFTPDSGGATVGLVGHTFLVPHDGGFDVLQIDFADFDPGEEFTFSVDVDPSSIQGSAAPGPNESGSVSGLELVRADVTVDFDDLSQHAGQTFRRASSLTDSEVVVKPASLAAPGVQVLGEPVLPASVASASQTVRVSGPPGADVALLVLEGGLFVGGLPGGGFDVEPFEANSVIAVSETAATIGGGGSVDVPITLTRSDVVGGINHVLATLVDGEGHTGGVSSAAVLDFNPPLPISFSKSTLAGATPTNPTSLQFGPDGRLYVAQQNGLIRVYDIVQQGPDSYSVAAFEQISLIQQIPNHDDDGSPNPAITTRQVTGLLVVGTPANPVIYVGSSDPRIGGGSSGSDLGLDTNSGVISRLTWNGTSWDKLDLVRGLPRSEENHSVNGIQLDPVTNTLYLTIGGNTNAGAPSNNFAFTPEFALSAAVLSIDLDAIGESTYDLPTLDDEDRPGAPDANDPFGGNDGKNQALLVPGGPVQVYAPGFRNAYDVVITTSGRMYAIDNGPNAGWGAPPVGEGTPACTNAIQNSGLTYPDNLHYIDAPGYYGGHPNPTRANPANTFNGSNPQSPVTAPNPVECDYRIPGVEDGALATWTSSTNGIAEYRSAAFGGAMQGDLLAASLGNTIERVKLDAQGDTATLVETLFSSVGTAPLDITTQGDSESFPGTIWVADYAGNQIVVYEPLDTFTCTGAYTAGLDEDGDGYDNTDEIDNGTDPCSPADLPSDHDGDFLSDLNDPDDDNDGLLDPVDPFAVDALNGADTPLPVRFTWDNNASGEGGLLDLGFTGLMTNGVDDYQSLFDPAQMTAGGAAGVTTIDAVSEGDALDLLNSQEYGFQFGVDATPTNATTFTVHTRVLLPFNGITPQDFQSMGLMIGTGSQDDYAKLVVTANGGAGGVEFGSEISGSYATGAVEPLSLAGVDAVDLFLVVDPVASTVEPFFQATSGGVPGPLTAVGGTTSIPTSWLSGPTRLAVGILSTSRGPAPEFAATWDFVEVVPVTPACSDGVDNDRDGSIDLADAGCSGPDDESEQGSLLDDFTGLSAGAEPPGWVDTGPNNSLLVDDSLFAVFDVAGDPALGTTSTATNIHSHRTGTGIETLSGYQITGRMRITDPSGGIGITFFSQFPNTAAYYRLRRFGSNDFHLSPFGTMMTGGDVDSGVVPLADTWYRFRVEVEDTGTRTEMRANVWADGAAEPALWQIDAYDDSATRLTGGTIGVWSFQGGSKFWDDLQVVPLGTTPPPSNLVLSLTVAGDGQVDVSPDQPTYTQGDVVTLTATPNSGSVFVGWSGDLSGSLNPETLVMNGNRSVTAQFAPITQHTLTLGTAGTGSGSVTANPDQPLYDLGSQVTLTATPDPGSVFVGWSGDLSGTTNPDVVTISGDLSIVASFAPDTAIVSEDFTGLLPGSDPPGWVDTGPNVSLVVDDSLFQVIDVSGDPALGTFSTATNIHSHLVGAGIETLPGYEITGRMRISEDGGIGITFFSQFPSVAAYYRLRRFGGNDFHLSPFGTMMTGGDVDSGVVPLPNTWYRFRVEVEDTGTRTEMRANVWADGAAEPATWQIDAYDDSATRLTGGTIGVWTYQGGTKLWDDLQVRPLPEPAAGLGLLAGAALLAGLRRRRRPQAAAGRAQRAAAERSSRH